MDKQIINNSDDCIDLSEKLTSKNDTLFLFNPLRTSPEGMISPNYFYDVMSAYGFPGKISSFEIFFTLQKKPSFPYLWEVILSNRYPTTIMLLASKIGMYIPPKFRVGLHSYNFYLANVKYYDLAISRLCRGDPLIAPTFSQIYLASDHYKFLIKFRDDEILQANYKFSRNYSDRSLMIKKFIDDNIIPFGEFSLLTNSQSAYNNRAKNIKYTEGTTVLYYSTSEFIRAIDLRFHCIWKNSSAKIRFKNLCLIKLRHQIFELITKWKNRDPSKSLPKELVTILSSLDIIIS